MGAQRARRAAAWAGRVILVAACLLVAVFLGWEFAIGAPAWSNGWMEGASYAVGAALLLASAGLLMAGRTRERRLYLCAALALAIPAAWCARWTFWLLTAARDIGPVPPYAPLLTAAAGALFLTAAAALARRAWRTAT